MPTPTPPTQAQPLIGSGSHETTLGMVERSARGALAGHGFDHVRFERYRVPADLGWQAVLDHYQPQLAGWTRIEAIPELRLAATMRAWRPEGNDEQVFAVLLIDSPEPGLDTGFHILLEATVDGSGSSRTER